MVTTKSNTILVSNHLRIPPQGSLADCFKTFPSDIMLTHYCNVIKNTLRPQQPQKLTKNKNVEMAILHIPQKVVYTFLATDFSQKTGKDLNSCYVLISRLFP